MKHQPQFYFNPEDGSSLCIITTKTKTYIGSAQCADADRDMMNEKTGCEIAYHRAIINSLKDRRDELKIKLSALSEYYYSMSTSKWFNPDSYEARRLNAHLIMLSDDIQFTKELLQSEQKYLQQYMADKADFYKKIRKNRQVNSNQ